MRDGCSGRSAKQLRYQVYVPWVMGLFPQAGSCDRKQAHHLDCILHAIHQALQPDFNVALCIYRLLKLNLQGSRHSSVKTQKLLSATKVRERQHCLQLGDKQHKQRAHLFSLLAEHLQHASLVHLVKCHIAETVKQSRLEMRHNTRWITSKREDLQKCRVGDKVEPAASAQRQLREMLRHDNTDSSHSVQTAGLQSMRQVHAGRNSKAV